MIFYQRRGVCRFRTFLLGLILPKCNNIHENVRLITNVSCSFSRNHLLFSKVIEIPQAKIGSFETLLSAPRNKVIGFPFSLFQSSSCADQSKHSVFKIALFEVPCSSTKSKPISFPFPHDRPFRKYRFAAKNLMLLGNYPF